MRTTPKPARPAPRCHIPWQQMVIDSTGYVAPCCYWGAVDNMSGEALGDINAQTIDEIWNGPGYQKLRAGMAAGDLEAAGCANCHAVRQGHALAFEWDTDVAAEAALPDGQKSRYAKNIAILRREIAAGATVLEAKPTIVSYTPSHRCNIRCTHCYQETTRTAEISRERAHHEVAAIAPYLVRLVAGGGEPFLLPMWIKFLNDFDLSQNPYLDFSTSTNATILSDRVVEGLKRFKKLTINVSLDGTGAAFERVRIGAKFAAVRNNIQRLKTIVGGTPSANSALGVSMCVMKSNILDLPNFVRFCAAEGLAFGITPVTMLPPAESLRHFKDGVAETRGWSLALKEAETLVHTLYLPRMAARRNAVPHAVEHSFWANNFKLLREAIPFDLATTDARPVEVKLPAQLQRRFAALRRAANEAASPPSAQVFVYQIGKPDLPYTSGLASKALLRVTLPPGSYCLTLPQYAGEIPQYWDVVAFDVPATGDTPIVARYRALTRRRVSDRLKRALRHPRVGLLT